MNGEYSTYWEEEKFLTKYMYEILREGMTGKT